MPYAKDTYTADGSTQTFAVTFPFISRDHVTVTADGSTATFTWVNDSSITITSPAALTTETIIIKRQSSPGTLLVDFVDGSNLTETDLDLAAQQQFYLAQENIDETGSVGFADLDDFSDSAVATTDADILVTNGTTFTNVAMSGDATIDNTGAVTIATGAVTSGMILDGTIVDGDINSSAGIDASKIADGSVSDTEFQYINSLTSNAQDQLDNITAGTINFPSLTSITVASGDSIALGDADNSEATRKDTVSDVLAVYDSQTSTLTNKTIDANGTGNSITNIDVADLANGTDGELITWGADATATTVAAGSSGQVLTSNGAGAAPTFQATSGASNGFAVAMAIAL